METRGIPSGFPSIPAKAHELTDGKHTPLQKLESILCFMQDDMKF